MILSLKCSLSDDKHPIKILRLQVDLETPQPVSIYSLEPDAPIQLSPDHPFETWTIPYEAKHLGAASILSTVRYISSRTNDPQELCASIPVTVQNPLSIRTKLAPIPPFSDSKKIRVCLELQIRNEAGRSLLVHSVNLDMDPQLSTFFTLESFPIDTPLDLEPGDVYQFMFTLAPISSKNRDYPDCLGIIHLDWSTADGSSRGRLQTNPLPLRCSPSSASPSISPIPNHNASVNIQLNTPTIHPYTPFSLDVHTEIHNSDAWSLALGPRHDPRVYLLGNLVNAVSTDHTVLTMAVFPPEDTIEDIATGNNTFRIHIQLISASNSISDALIDIFVQ